VPSLPTIPTPREVFERQLQTIASQNWSAMAELYADDAVVELPFNRPSPLRIDGRAQLEARGRAAHDLPLQLRPENLVIHETTDPEVIVAEFDYAGRVTTTGRTFRVANVIVARIRDGKIVASRDYHNHVAIGDALGELAEVLTTAAAPALGSG
jgi:ketosteroid isomerase-like protein